MIRSLFFVLLFPVLAIAQEPAPEPTPAPGPAPAPDPQEIVVDVDVDVIELQPGILHEKFELRSWSRPTIINAQKSIFLANENQTQDERYPFSLRFSDQPIAIFGATIIGQQSRELTWREVKDNYDGDGIRIESTDRQVITGAYVENVEDGFAPRGNRIDSYFVLDSCWFRYVRDDAIESDALISGRIHNCFFDGVFMFLSCRPGGDAQPPEGFDESPVFEITDSLIRLEPMPNDSPKTRFADDQGRAHGQFWKWSAWGGSVICRDCVFRMDQYAARGKTPMTWPPGTYENVTLVWLGPGDYPQPLPAGVTVTTDVQVWNKARHQWIESNAWRFGNRQTLQDLQALDPAPKPDGDASLPFLDQWTCQPKPYQNLQLQD